MRTILVLLPLLGLTVIPAAAQQTVIVGAQNLAGWSLVGTTADEMSSASGLVLPPGAQIARTYGAGDLALRITTQPVIGQVPADWPVLEIGAAALVFSRSGGAGKLVLVIGNEGPVDLPFTLGLDAAGRCSEPLTVGFAREGGVVRVEASGQTLDFAATLAPHAPLEVVISAGAGQPFEVTQVEVSAGVLAPIAPSGASGAPVSDPVAARVGPGAAVTEPEVFPTGTLLVSLIDPTGATVRRVVAVPAPPAAGAITLEVFTPPAFRHGRAEHARGNVAQGKQP